MPHNERGEIINSSPESGRNHIAPINEFPRYIGGSYWAEKRKTFMTVTLIISPIIYSIVGIILNSVFEADLDPALALLLGAIFGFLCTLIFNVSKGKEDDGETKEYFYSLGIPAGVVLTVGGGAVILIVVLMFWALGMFMGGG